MERKDLRRTFKLIPLEKAKHELIKAAQIEPLGSEEVALENSFGRVLAENIVSEVNIPEYSVTVYDGYAIQSADTTRISAGNPVLLEIVGETFPGDTSNKLFSGQAVFTACGSPLPKGADAVIKSENVRLLKDKIEVRFRVDPGESVSLTGEDVQKGRLILKKGCFLRPQDVGLLAGMKMSSVNVFKKPKVGIISVGDELVKLGMSEPGKTVNNYAFIISSLVSAFGASPRLFGPVPDNLEKIKRTISEALEETHIVTIISGCSVGPKDLVPDAIKALNESGLVFHGVKLRPGKVMGAGIVKEKPVVMLPGHIVSAYASFYLLVTPLIAQYSGLGKSFPLSIVGARITRDVKAKPTASFLRIRLTKAKDTFEAEPVYGRSSVLATLINAHGYTIVPRGKHLRKGSVVQVTLFDQYELSHLTPQ